jgi:hypothetical protein
MTRVKTAGEFGRYLGGKVDFFSRRRGPSQTLLDLLTPRGEYRPAFGFVIGCLPALLRLHLRTARDNLFLRGSSVAK